MTAIIKARTSEQRMVERCRIIIMTDEGKTLDDIANALEISKSTVNRILLETDLKPHKVEMWLTSKDPEFDEKCARVVGLYINPPENALVISVVSCFMAEPDRIVVQHPGQKVSQEKHICLC